jgi:flagellar biosynthesis/type III secretory pathway ATPase
MEEMVQRISEAAGISNEQAQLAAESMLSFLKEKLPAPLALQVGNILDGHILIEEEIAQIKVSHMFAGSKE